MKQRVLFATIMGGLTTCLVSFSVIAINIGFVQKFMTIWLKAWGTSFMIALPVIVFVSLPVQRLVNYLCQRSSQDEISTL